MLRLSKRQSQLPPTMFLLRPGLHDHIYQITRSHLSDYAIKFIRLHDHIYDFYYHIYILLNFPNKTFLSKALMKHTKCTKTTSDYARIVKTRFQINAGIVWCSEFNSFPFFFILVPRSFLSHQTNVSKLFAILNLDKLHLILLVFFFLLLRQFCAFQVWLENFKRSSFKFFFTYRRYCS